MSVSATFDAQRRAVVAAARAWIGTPYHHAADVKGAGVDCAMILVRVFCDLGLVRPFDPRPYTRDWMLHRDDERYLNLLLERAREVDPTTVAPGDVALFRVGRCYAHGGVVVGAAPLLLVHAFSAAGCVVEEEIARNRWLAERPARFFSFWGG